MIDRILPHELTREDRIAGQHAAYDLMYWLYETRPDLVAEERINRTTLEQPDALAVLNAAWQRGALSEAEYQAIYDRLDRQHGKRCACGGQGICTQLDGSLLCGTCMLKSLGVEP